MQNKKVFSGKLVFNIISFTVMFLFGFSFVFILFWIFFNSLRSGASFAEFPFKLFSDKLTFQNYANVFKYTTGRNKTNIIGMMLNSLILIVAHIVLGLIPAISGYIGAKYNFKIKKLITNVIIITMVIPTVGTLSATYKFINTIGLYDNFLAIFLMGSGGLGFGYLLYRNYFSAIPWEYAESAFIDGAGNFRVFFQIMFPQAKPLIVSMVIMSIIGTWNDFFTPYMYLPSHPTIALGVNNIYVSYVKQGQNYPVIFAAMSITTGLVLVLYAFFSKTIMSSMAAGGLKG